MSMPKKTIDRREFIRRWMDECGVTYDAAKQIYRTMVSTFEDGVADGSKVTIGRLGALVPKWRPAREVVKGFDRTPGGGVVKTRKTYYLDDRIHYKFSLYREWVNGHQLNWTMNS